MHYDSDNYLRTLRDYELTKVLSSIPKSSHVLEIGAGCGWQSKRLAVEGCHVEAVDVAGSRYLSDTVFPVQIYDGKILPYPDQTFDVVFSSNVLEHIPHLDFMQKEIYRVLKTDGKAIHILPTSAWRLWTSVTHPLYVVRGAFWLMGKQHRQATFGESSAKSIPWRYVIWPNRHGEHGNSLTELYWFSRYAWVRHFTSAGWLVEAAFPIRIFYTGNRLLEQRLSITRRAALGRLLGSSSGIYILRTNIVSY